MSSGGNFMRATRFSADLGSTSEIDVELSRTASRSSSRLSTDTFGQCRTNSPSSPNSQSESWRTAREAAYQSNMSGAPHDESDISSPHLMTPRASTSSTISGATHHFVRGMPELSRSTSTVNPTTPSTTHFPHDQMAFTARSGSMPSLKETLIEEKNSPYGDWKQGRVYARDGKARPRGGPIKPSQNGHVHNVSVSTNDAAEWEDIDTNDKDDVDGLNQSDSETDGPPAWTYEIPNLESIQDAAGCHVIDEWGKMVRFGDMLPGGPAWRSATLCGKPVTKLVVLFVGHWWCGLCHEYALNSVSKLSPAALIREGVRVVIISSGSWKPIAKYRRLFNVKFPVFVDNGTRLYRALGMRTATPNPFSEAMIKNRPKYHKHAFAREMTTGMVKGIFRLGGIKFQNPGSFTQLGGEFVFTNDFKCTFAHRMTGRSDHCEAPDVLSAVGVQSSLGEPVSNVDKEDEDPRQSRVRLKKIKSRTPSSRSP